MFDYDFFYNGGLDGLVAEAKERCARKKYPDVDGDEPGDEFEEYREGLDTRIILYIKDGLTYELKELVSIESHRVLCFECVPMDENYKVGSIVIMTPFEDVARVEVFAVSAAEKPADNIRIPGFHAAAENHP